MTTKKWMRLRGIDMKECKDCKETKALFLFPKNKTYASGYASSCKDCKSSYAKKWAQINQEKIKEKKSKYHFKNKDKSRDQYLQKTYGITSSEFDLLNEQQQGRCAICGIKGEHNRWGVLVVDHCHKTGDVRKLLCNNCNTGLGLFKDNPKLLRTAALYLEENG